MNNRIPARRRAAVRAEHFNLGAVLPRGLTVGEVRALDSAEALLFDVDRFWLDEVMIVSKTCC